MLNGDFKKFCYAMAQSCARQASVLHEKARSLPADEIEQKVYLERRADSLSDLMEVYDKAQNWWTE